MTHALVGTRVRITVSIRDKDSNALVDPAALLFTLKPPSTVYPPATYSWNGSGWNSSEMVIGVPSRVSTGVFLFTMTLPYSNSAAGKWTLGWKSTQNGLGLGEGSGETQLLAAATGAL